MFRNQDVMHKYFFLFILLCLMAVRAGAQETKLCTKVGDRAVCVTVILIDDKDGGYLDLDELWDSFNSGRQPRNAGAQAVGQPEVYGLSEFNSRLLPNGDGGGLQLPDQTGTTAAGSSETRDCSVAINRPAGSDSLRLQRAAADACLRFSERRADNSEENRWVIPTGMPGVTAWLQNVPSNNENRVREEAPVYRIPVSRLTQIPGLIARLSSTERDNQVRGIRPVPRVGNYICDSSVNPDWRYGRWIAPLVGLSTLGSGGVGCYLGATALACAAFMVAALATPISTWLPSYTPLENEYEVSFSFNWDTNPIVEWDQVVYLAQIYTILRGAVRNDGDHYYIASVFSQDSQSQILRFRVRTIRTITEERLRTALNSEYQGIGRRFRINVSKYTADQTTKPVNDG